MQKKNKRKTFNIISDEELLKEVPTNNMDPNFEEIVYGNGQKYIVPKLHSCPTVIEKNKLPHRPREGYYRVWLVDKQPLNDILPYLRVGYRPVAGEMTPYAGTKENGEPYFHILHEIPLEQHEKIIAEKNNLNNQKLYSQLVSTPEPIYGPGRVPYARFTVDRRI